MLPHILYLCEFGAVHGGENSLLAVLDEIRNHYEIFVLAPRASDLEGQLVARGFSVIPSPLTPAMSLAEKRECLREIFLALHPALIHSNSLSMGRIAGVVAQSLNIKAVAHLRDIVKLSRAAIDALNTHCALIAVSECVRSFHAAQGIYAEKIRVIYNGIDGDAFRRETIAPDLRFGITEPSIGIADGSTGGFGYAEPILLATIGQISLRKGVASIPFIYDQLRVRLPREVSLHWLIVGKCWSNKNESRQLEATLHRAAKTREIHLLGTREDVAAILSAITIYVHPAWEEPFGRVLLEAAVCGVPIVARDAGGTREMLSETASLVTNNSQTSEQANDQELVEAIHALIKNPSLRAAQSTAAQQRVQQLFTIPHAVENLHKLYQEVLERAL